MKFLVGWVLFFPPWLALVMQSFSIASFLLLCRSDIHQQFQCNVVHKLWWESNKSFVLLSKVHPIHASTVSNSRQKQSRLYWEKFQTEHFHRLSEEQRCRATSPALHQALGGGHRAPWAQTAVLQDRGTRTRAQRMQVMLISQSRPTEDIAATSI